MATGSAVAVTPDGGLVARTSKDAEHPNEADEPQGKADEDHHDDGGESKDGEPSDVRQLPQLFERHRQRDDRRDQADTEQEPRLPIRWRPVLHASIVSLR